MDSSYERISRSKLFGLGEIIWDLMSLSLLWILFSLPIVTSGAASAALYYAVRRRFQLGFSTPAKDFMKSFKQNLKQGLIINLIFMIYGSITGFNLYIALHGFGGITLPEGYLPIAILLTLPILIFYPLTFPYLSRFDIDTKHTLMNSALLTLMNPVKAIVIWIYMLVTFAAMILFPPCALIAPAGITCVIMRMIEKIFSAATDKEGQEDA